MTTPTPEQVTVATETLRSEAGIWEAQSGQLGTILPKAEGLRLNRIEAGLFQVIFDTYATVIDQVTQRVGEGQQRMSEVGATLRSVADTYDQEEARNEHSLRNLY
jgi:uncharacterized protein YukE